MNETSQSDRPTVGVPRETSPGEQRVALVPANVSTLAKAGIDVLIEPGAGEAAGFLDSAFTEHNARLASDRQDVFAKADIVLQVRAAGANPDQGQQDVALLREGQILIAGCDPLSTPEPMRAIAERKAMCFTLELVPRITRSQSMDILSSMATVAGYKAVLMAANAAPRMFPMMMTAAGTISPARVLVVGAGVAGLQAISTARRLGAVVFGYDIRPAVREQVESLGARFVEMNLDTGDAEGKGGYAKEMEEDFYLKQQELMAKTVADCNVVITTAAIPGRKSPVLITADMVRGMSPGSVIVDLAAERGGNCELTRASEEVVTENGVTILGPVNLPSTIPFHASEMYSKNITTFLLNMVKDGKVCVDTEDEIVRETLVTRDGKIVLGQIRELLDLEPLSTDDAPSQDSPGRSEPSQGTSLKTPDDRGRNVSLADRDSRDETARGSAAGEDEASAGVSPERGDAPDDQQTQRSQETSESES